MGSRSPANPVVPVLRTSMPNSARRSRGSTRSRKCGRSWAMRCEKSSPVLGERPFRTHPSVRHPRTRGCGRHDHDAVRHGDHSRLAYQVLHGRARPAHLLARGFHIRCLQCRYRRHFVALTGQENMNFFTALAADLKGPLGTLKTEELAAIGPALAAVIPAVLANPTKAGLIEAAAPAVIKIAAAQPSLLVELLSDLTTAVGQIEAPKT